MVRYRLSRSSAKGPNDEVFERITRKFLNLAPFRRKVMATIEVRCRVQLLEPIVLATQQNALYGPIC